MALVLASLLCGAFLTQPVPSVDAQIKPDQPQKHKKGPITVEGCVERLRGDYILVESDGSNSYVLQSAGNIKLGQYHEQEVQVKGTKSPTIYDSADSARWSPATTIEVNSVVIIADRCWS